MHPQGQPRILSNEFDAFVTGGIYRGGRVQVLEFMYKIHDYNGKQPPNSLVGVIMKARPVDGSNDGKDVEVIWNVGNAADFQPVNDGAHIAAIGAKDGPSDQSNWHFVYQKMRETCGLKPGAFSGQRGIRAMEGSEMFLAMVPAPARDFGNQPQPQPGQQGQPGGQQQRRNEILVPTQIRYAWEAGGAAQYVPQVQVPVGAPMQAPYPPQVQPQQFQAPVGAPVVATAPAPVMAAPGAVPGTDPASIAIPLVTSLLAANGNRAQISTMPMTLLTGGYMNNITAAQRPALLEYIKNNLESLAMVSGWQVSPDGFLVKVQ